MTESTYAAMREFIKVAVELEVGRRIGETRSVETRADPIPGPAGRDGIDGKDGRDGKDGKDGEPGPAGPPGERGERGADGLNGRDGAPGPQGERGADGIATLEELDARIEARFAELQVRTFADLYQGTFVPERTYTRGLLTTWGGSLWLSLNETNARPGEGNNDWRLVVKRGADGRK